MKRKDVSNIAMKRTIFKQSLLMGVAVLGLASAVPLAAYSVPAHAHEARTNTDEDRRATVQTRLADAKLKACQNREKAITNIMSRLSDRGQKQVDLFSKIAVRTEAFYADKGKTLANYDTLVADVATKKTAAQNAVDTLKATSTKFTCDGDNPKGIAGTFKDSLKTQSEALKAYKTSVKNLIVGVKSVQGTTSSAENGGTN